MNIQAEAKQDEDKGLVYNHDEARVLATIITTFNKRMEHTAEEQGKQYISLSASRQASTNLANKPRPQLI